MVIVDVVLGLSELLEVEIAVLTDGAIILVGDTESAVDEMRHGPGNPPEHLDVKTASAACEDKWYMIYTGVIGGCNVHMGIQWNPLIRGNLILEPLSIETSDVYKNYP